MKKSTRLLAMLLSLVMMFTICPGMALAETNVIINGDMETGVEGKAPSLWTAYFTADRGAQGSASWVKDGGKEGSGLLLDIVSDGTKTNSMGLTYDLKEFTVKEGQEYIFTLDAKVEGAPSFEFKPIWLRNITANEKLTSNQTLTVSGDSWKTYTVKLTGTKDFTGVRVMLQSGNTGASNVKVYLDNVSLTGGGNAPSSSTPSASTPAPSSAPSSAPTTTTEDKTPAVAPEGQENVLSNSGMDNGSEGKAPKGWRSTITESRGAKGSFTWQSTGGNDGACALLEIVSDGTNSNSYGIDYEQKQLKVEEGKNYTLTFDAKVEGVPSFKFNNIWLRSASENLRLTTSRNTLDIVGNTWKTYTYEMTASISSEGTKLMLQSGNNGCDGAKVYIDNVQLFAPKGAAGEIVESEPTQAPAQPAKPENTSDTGNTYDPPALTPSPFEDCTNHWARPEVEIMQLQGVINGKSTTIFAPEDNITRAEFLALVIRAVGIAPAPYANAYADVASDKWYADTVQGGYNAGIINAGMTPNGFEPEKAITREEMTSMIAAGYKAMKGQDADKADISQFTDNDTISAWAKDDVKKAYGLGIIKGMTETTFAPKANATRAQAAVMMFRLLSFKDNKIVKTGFNTGSEGWVMSYRTGGVAGNALNGEGKTSWIDTDGDAAKGCMLFDMTFTGRGQSNSEQWVYTIKNENGKNILNNNKTYLVTFSAKLEGAKAYPINIIKFRDVDNNNDEYTDKGKTIVRGEGWNRYYAFLTANRDASVTKFIMQAGGCDQKNVKLYLDDFAIFEIQKFGSLTGIAAPGSESVAAISGSGSYPEGAESELTAAAKGGSNYLFDKWTDKYGNIIDQSSIYSAKVAGNISVTANFKPYTITDKNINVSSKSNITKVTLTKPVISGETVSATANVSVPEGYTVADAGILFLDECYTDNYNVFTEKAQNIPADVSADGTFAATASGIAATKDVLVKAYSIIKDKNGNYLVQYSDAELIQRKSGSIKPYKLINNHEMMHNFTSSGTDPYVKREADHFINVYAGTDVEMITITPHLYRTNTWPSEVDTQWKDFDPAIDGERVGGGAGAVPVIYEYLKSGGDPFQEMIDVCRENNFDVFVNHRMNDSHNTGYPTAISHNRFYRNNPQWHLYPGTSNDPLNYIHPEVRDYYFALLEETVTKYDVDGLEMDFERAPFYFRAEELAVGTEIMTNFVGRVRAMLDRVGEQKGKYLPLSVRVCKSLRKSNDTGLDVAKWDELGYIDMINITHHYYLTTEIDVESYIEEVDNARIMAELNPLTREVGMDNKKMRQFVSPEAIKATTSNFLARGVDGISLFNMNYGGDQEGLCINGFTGLTDDGVRAKAEKHYMVGPGHMIFQAKGEKTYELMVPEDTSNFSSALFRVEMASDCTNETIEVTVNGVKLQETTKEGDTELFGRGADKFNNAYYPTANFLKYYTLPLSTLKNGVNTFTVKATSNPNAIIMATDFALYH